MSSKTTRGFCVAAITAALLGLVLLGCGKNITPKLVVTSVKEGAVASHGLSRDLNAPAFSGNVVAESPDFEISGPPDYLTVTLKRIVLTGDFAPSPYTAWQGSQDLRLDGTGNVDTSGILLNLPIGTLTSVELVFSPQSKVSGSILDKQILIADPGTPSNTDTISVYTTAADSYDTYSQTGGADLTAFETGGPAQEMDYSLFADQSETTVTTASSATIAAGDSPTLTILFDLSRVLRFYDGKRGQNDGMGPGNAYFYTSVFPQSVAAFIGEAGTIQGYESHYNGYESLDPPTPVDLTNPHAVPGWMTLIFDAQGNFLSGNLMGDSDTSWTVAKGNVTAYSQSNGSAEIQYVVGSDPAFSLHGFVRQTEVGQYTPLTTWDITAPTYLRSGEAYFLLKLQQ